MVFFKVRDAHNLSGKHSIQSSSDSQRYMYKH